MLEVEEEELVEEVEEEQVVGGEEPWTQRLDICA